ncbi:cytidine deaminase [Verrucomicrobia bacterium LW23]|nr:cytidine deaminase [Verrucomicrobia bacterium LW23]
MRSPQDQELINAARPFVRKMILSRHDFDAGGVASAIRTVSGNIYTGVCIHLTCGIGFCAEHAAAAEMIKHGETQIESIVAVSKDWILSPCGRCREFLLQIDSRNANAHVILPKGRKMLLRELMPMHWLTDHSWKPEW